MVKNSIRKIISHLKKKEIIPSVTHLACSELHNRLNKDLSALCIYYCKKARRILIPDFRQDLLSQSWMNFLEGVKDFEFDSYVSENDDKEQVLKYFHTIIRNQWSDEIQKVIGRKSGKKKTKTNKGQKTKDEPDEYQIQDPETKEKFAIIIRDIKIQKARSSKEKDCLYIKLWGNIKFKVTNKMITDAIYTLEQKKIDILCTFIEPYPALPEKKEYKRIGELYNYEQDSIRQAKGRIFMELVDRLISQLDKDAQEMIKSARKNQISLKTKSDQERFKREIKTLDNPNKNRKRIDY